MIRAYLIACLTCALSGAWASPLFAQGGESTQILGVVEDSTGAVIPGVVVTATHLATGQTRKAVTGESGTYVFPLMAPGEYNVRAEIQGFKADVRTGLILQLNQKARVDFRLQVGAVSETVEVSAKGVILHTDDATMGNVVEQKRIVDLPLNGRNFANLAGLMPGVIKGISSNTNQSGRRDTAIAISANGMRENQGQALYDGVSTAWNINNATFFKASIPAMAQNYDLLLKGGHVIDPKNGTDAVRDVAIAGGKIAAIAPRINADDAKKVIDARGLYVTPGLIDIHAHVFAGSRHNTTAGGDRSVFPDQASFRSGVTTMVDPGSSGWRSFEEFRRTIIDVARTRVLAMINIAGVGILSYELEQNVEDLNPQLTAAMAKKHSDVVVGVKSAHWWAPNFISVQRAVEAGKLAGIPVMVDFGYFLKDRPYQKMVLEILRPGDISTHCYRWPSPLLDESEKLRPYLAAARKRGVKFDVGHGGGSFHFRNAEPAVKQGFWPDSISTDLHTNSMNGSAIDMPNIMSKFLAMGVPLAEVIRRSTTNPATQIGRPQLGQISLGAEADIALMRLEKGSFGFVDVVGGRIEGKERIGCEMTLRAGNIVFDFNGRAGVPWREGKLKYPEK